MPTRPQPVKAADIRYQRQKGKREGRGWRRAASCVSWVATASRGVSNPTRQYFAGVSWGTQAVEVDIQNPNLALGMKCRPNGYIGCVRDKSNTTPCVDRIHS